MSPEAVGLSARLAEWETSGGGSPTHGFALAIAVGCAAPDPDEPVTTGTHLTPRIRRTEHEVTRSERNLFTLDEHRAAAAAYRVHLFLAVRGVVVLRPFPIRWKLEPIDLELAHSKRCAQPTKHAIGRLDVACVYHRMCHLILRSSGHRESVGIQAPAVVIRARRPPGCEPGTWSPAAEL